MWKAIDRTGEKFGRLTAVEKVGKASNGAVIWRCLCECGKITDVSASSLKTGGTRSCGCLKREVLVARGNNKHGMCSAPEYQAWVDMRGRCNSKRGNRYKYYGSRGIKVCKQWQESFLAFYTDMGDRPGKGYSLDRINNDGDYEPDNCRWIMHP